MYIRKVPKTSLPQTLATLVHDAATDTKSRKSLHESDSSGNSLDK